MVNYPEEEEWGYRDYPEFIESLKEHLSDFDKIEVKEKVIEESLDYLSLKSDFLPVYDWVKIYIKNRDHFELIKKTYELLSASRSLLFLDASQFGYRDQIRAYVKNVEELTKNGVDISEILKKLGPAPSLTLYPNLGFRLLERGLVQSFGFIQAIFSLIVMGYTEKASQRLHSILDSNSYNSAYLFLRPLLETAFSGMICQHILNPEFRLFANTKTWKTGKGFDSVPKYIKYVSVLES